MTIDELYPNALHESGLRMRFSSYIPFEIGDFL